MTGMGFFYTEAIQVLENQNPEFIGNTESTSGLPDFSQFKTGVYPSK
jgi:hypothetical protein